MKRFIIVLLALFIAAAVFTGCKKEEYSAGAEQMQIYFTIDGAFAADKGVYYFDNQGFLHFFDYNSNKTALVCSKTNCRHEQYTEDISDEEKCNAYIDLFSPVSFTDGDKLYFAGTDNSDGSRAVIYSCAADMSQRDILCSFNDNSMINQCVIKDKIMYCDVITMIMKENKDGYFSTTAENRHEITSINLSNGKKTVLKSFTEEESGYNSEIMVLGVKDDNLYFTHNYFETEFTGYNFDDLIIHKDVCSLNITTLETTVIKGGFENYSNMMMNLSISGDYFIGVILSDAVRGDYSTTYNTQQIFSCKLDGSDFNVWETIKDSSNLVKIIDGKILYASNDGNAYSIDTSGNKQKIDENLYNDFYFSISCGNYFFGTAKSNDYEKVMILKNDYYNGKQNYITIEQ